MEVSGARVLVTGGASGLGEATVRRLAERGARLGIIDLTTSRGADVSAEVEGVFAAADVRATDEVEAAVAD